MWGILFWTKDANEGYSGHKISQVVGVIPRTVNKFLKRVRERGNEENLHRPGRQRKTDIRGNSGTEIY
jgi:transposase